MKYTNYIGMTGFYNLNMACRILTEAFGFGWGVFLVGSSLKKRDFRDVDIRCILPDEEYQRLFPGLKGNPQTNPLWCLICTSISEWLAARTGLPIDFQIQMASEANAAFPAKEHPRNAIGLFLAPEKAAP